MYYRLSFKLVEVLTAVKILIVVVWIVMCCHHFGGTYRLHFQSSLDGDQLVINSLHIIRQQGTT